MCSITPKDKHDIRTHAAGRVGPLDSVPDMVGVSQRFANQTSSSSFVEDCDLLLFVHAVHIMTRNSLPNHIKRTAETGNDPWWQGALLSVPLAKRTFAGLSAESRHHEGLVCLEFVPR